MSTDNLTLHKNLDAWKYAMEMVIMVYKATDKFPNREQFGLTSQMRRAAVSIPSNIAEGAARNSNKEYIQFLYISLGSASELETQILICNRLGFLTDEQKENFIKKFNTLVKLLSGLIRYRKKLMT